jgi:hypothetical protein
MSNWIASDKHDFFIQTLGQIHNGTSEGKFIQKLLHETLGSQVKNVVEIGTWNGLGSTLCILNALQEYQSIPFFSLECCKEKQESAVINLEEFVTESTQLIWGTIVNLSRLNDSEYLMNFSDIQRDWYQVDFKNCEESPNVLSLLPEHIDFLLLDGGEYTTLNEFEILFPRCRHYILLDDTTQNKCRVIEQKLASDASWQKIFHSNERGGFSCWQRVPMR